MTGPAASPRPVRRVAGAGARLVAAVTLALVSAAACSSGGNDDAEATGSDAAPTTTAPTQDLSTLADAVEVLPPAPALPEAPLAGPEPTA